MSGRSSACGNFPHIHAAPSLWNVREWRLRLAFYTTQWLTKAEWGKCKASGTPAEVLMTRSTVHHRTPNALTSTWRRARRLQPAAGQAKPLARTVRAAARRHAEETRAWAVPQVERATQVLQDSIAPKASSLLSGAVHRIDRAPPRPLRWRKLAAASAAAASVAAAFAAVVRSRRKAGASAATDPAEAGDTTPGAETAPVAETHNGQHSPGSDVRHGSGARTS